MPANSRKTIVRSTLAGCAAMLACAAPALGGWREDVGTFRIGMVGEPGAGQSVAGLSALKKAYSSALGVPVEIIVAKSLPALIAAQADRRVDYAAYSAAAYAAAWQLCSCIEPVAAPIGADGSTGIRAVLLSRAGTAGSLTQAGGQRIAIASNTVWSASGELVKAVAAVGGGAPSLVDGISAEEAERLFVAGDVDFILGWEPVDASAAAIESGGTRARLASKGINAGSLLSLWHSQPVRYGPHAVRADLDGEAKRLLVAFLADLKDRQPEIYELVEFYHQGGFRPATHEDYRTAVEAAAAIAAAPRM